MGLQNFRFLLTISPARVCGLSNFKQGGAKLVLPSSRVHGVVRDLGQVKFQHRRGQPLPRREHLGHNASAWNSVQLGGVEGACTPHVMHPPTPPLLLSSLCSHLNWPRGERKQERRQEAEKKWSISFNYPVRKQRSIEKVRGRLCISSMETQTILAFPCGVVPVIQ